MNLRTIFGFSTASLALLVGIFLNLISPASQNTKVAQHKGSAKLSVIARYEKRLHQNSKKALNKDNFNNQTSELQATKWQDETDWLAIWREHSIKLRSTRETVLEIIEDVLPLADSEKIRIAEAIEGSENPTYFDSCNNFQRFSYLDNCKELLQSALGESGLKEFNQRVEQLKKRHEDFLGRAAIYEISIMLDWPKEVEEHALAQYVEIMKSNPGDYVKFRDAFIEKMQVVLDSEQLKTLAENFPIKIFIPSINSNSSYPSEDIYE